MKTLILLLLFPIVGYAGDSYIIEDLEKEGQVQAMKLNYNKKFDVTGGTVTGKTTYSDTVKFTTISLTNVASETTFNDTVTFSDTVNFTKATSTTVFSGWADFGLNIVTTVCTTAVTCTATCATGYKVLGGGGKSASTADYMFESYPSTVSSWQGGWHSTNGIKTVFAICARIK